MSSSSTNEGECSSSSPATQPSEPEQATAEVIDNDIELDGGGAEAATGEEIDNDMELDDGAEEAAPAKIIDIKKEPADAGADEEGDDDEDETKSSQSSDSISSEEIEALLDEGLPQNYRKPREFSVKEIVVLEAKGRNTLEGLPVGWIEVRHCSGMPLYLHRKTRVCSLSKPYNLGPASARRHPIPLSAIPCLAYSRALQLEKEQLEAAARPPEPVQVECKDSQDNSKEKTPGVVEGCPVVGPTNGGVKRHMVPNPFGPGQPGGKKMRLNNGVGRRMDLLLPRAKVETANENTIQNSIAPLALREYCQKLFRFKTLTCKRFKSWSARRKHNKQQKRIKLQRPSLPDGVKLITFPVYNSGDGDNSRANKEYVMNPQGKSSVCILHEYVQHALRLQPTYDFMELENAATPYAATVNINKIKYGTGYGSSKKQAKANAAKHTLEILIPDMKDQFDGPNAEKNSEIDHTVYFDQMELTDPRITSMCQNMSEPSPYTLLLTCLQRNFGKEKDTAIHFTVVATPNQCNKFHMKATDFSAEVSAANKKEGKQLASQAILAQIHPHIKNFGSFLRLYGNGSVKSVKEKKKEEQQITTLQSRASANSPNYAILAKLREELKKLSHFPKSSPESEAIGTEVNPTVECHSNSADTDAYSELQPNNAEVDAPSEFPQPSGTEVATLSEVQPQSTEVASLQEVQAPSTEVATLPDVQ